MSWRIDVNGPAPDALDQLRAEVAAREPFLVEPESQSLRRVLRHVEDVAGCATSGSVLRVHGAGGLRQDGSLALYVALKVTPAPF